MPIFLVSDHGARIVDGMKNAPAHVWPARTGKRAKDDALAKELWALSERLTA